VLLPTPCHMPPREKARHSKPSSRSGSRHPAPQPSVLALEGNNACMFESSATPPSVNLILSPNDVCMCNAEAETLQQRAERKRGREAVSAYEQAAVGEVDAQL